MPTGRNENMGIQGTGLKSSNPRSRFFGFVLITIVAFGVMFYWRHQTLKQAEYIAFPEHKYDKINSELRSSNYQLEVQDASPTAQ